MNKRGKLRKVAVILLVLLALASMLAYAASKGAISVTPGDTPFYTTNSNPQNCTLNASQSCTLIWQVNATGTLNSQYEFFGITNANTTNVTNVNSSKINITIVEMNISETLNISRAAVNEHVNVYGYLNLSNNDTANDNNVSVYADTTLLAITTTNGSGFYNYTFNLSTAGVYTIKVNATLNNLKAEETATLSVYSSTNKGEAIPTTTGAIPFYTNGTNPQNCSNMQDGSSCTLTWWVNATGSMDTTYEFYATSVSNYTENVSESNSSIINITIGELNAPVITIANPANDSSLAEGTAWTWINLTTDETAICRYNTTDEAYSNMTNFTNTDSTTHSFNYSGLVDGNSYTLYYKCKDGYDNVGSSVHVFSVNFIVDITETLDPSATDTLTNISIYGHVNLSNGTDLTNYNISIFNDNIRLYYNQTLGVLVNYTTPNITATDASGDYNYTFTVPAAGGSYTIKVNATYTGITGEQTASLTVYSDTVKLGAIPTTAGAKPFYTTNANPQNCTLTASQSCLLTWQVNATGALNTPFEFYGITSANTTNVTDVNSSKINITIVEMTISETLNQSSAQINESVNVYGYLNLSNGDTANNNNVSVYAGNSLLGATTTNGSGFYNYTFNLSTGGVYTIKVNATLNNIIGEQTASLTVYSDSVKLGAVSTTTGAIPFYTNGTNPQNCSNMQDGSSCTLTWWVNATGSMDTTYEFYATFVSNYTENVSESNSSIINITIGELNAPVITIVNPTNDSSLSEGTAWTWINLTTDENAICRYNTTDEAYSDMTNFTNTDSTTHSFNYSGLSDGGSYTLYYKCRDKYDNTGSASHVFSVNFTVDITETLNPSATDSSTNITIYGHVNLSNGTDLINYNISIYLDNLRLYYNQTLGVLVNYTTPNITTTDASGDYNYTYTVPATGGTYSIKVNATYSGVTGEQTASLTVYSDNIKSGAISTVEGTKPFYTIDSNPQNCTLTASQSCTLTWQVNATGALNTPFEFYGISDANDTNVANVNSSKINITIVEMTISETLNPSRVAVNENTSVYGYANTSDGASINNHNISIYADNVRYYYNSTSGLLDTTSSGATTTNENGFYNYTFNLATAGVYTIKVNATLNNIIGEQTATLSVYSSTNKGGAIPTTTGAKPFYTNGTNPQTCSNMQDGDNCTLTWWVNATGNENSVYEFYATSESISYSANISQSNSSRINITIIKEISWVLTLNDVDGNIYINVNDNVKIEVNLTTPSTGDMSVYRDSQILFELFDGNYQSYQDSSYPDDRYYNITVIFPAQESYSLTTVTHYVIVGPDDTNPTATLLSPEDNAWFNVQDVNFTFTANDNYLENLNCSIFINNVLNQTNSNVSLNTNTPFNITGISEGSNQTWNVTCWDNTSNSGSSSRTFNIDLTAPTANITSPSNGTIFYDPTPTITVNLSDNLASTLSYVIYANNEINKQGSGITNSVLTNITLDSLSAGNYSIIVEAEDTAGNKQNSSTISITLSTSYVDLVSPSADYKTTTAALNYTFNFIDDQYGSSNCSLYLNGTLDQTSNVSTNANVTFNSSNLAEGLNQNWEIRCITPTYNRSDTRTINADYTTPTYSSETATLGSPANYSLSGVEFNITISDNIQIDTIIFENDFNGSFVNTTLSCSGSAAQKVCSNTYYPAPGNYSYRYYMNDSFGLTNQTSLLYYNVTRAAPNITLTADSWSVITGHQTNITCSIDNNQTNITLYRNETFVNSSLGSSISDVQNLSIGNYIYICNNSQTQNYTAYSVNKTLNITPKLTDAVSLYLNGNENNLTITYGTQSNATATSSSGTHSLFRNNTNVDSENGLNITLAVGYYEYKANSTGNENYTAATPVIYYLNVTRAAPNITLTADSWNATLWTGSNVTCSVDNAQTNISLYRNSSYINSSLGGSISDIANLSVGNYSYVCNNSQTQNYTAYSVNNTLNITKITDTLNLYLNGNENNLTITYGTQSNATATSSSGTESLYRDNVSVSNPEITTLVAGYYEYKANSTGNANYTAGTLVIYYLNITRNTSICSLLFNPPNPADYNESGFNVSCSCTNPEETNHLYRNGTLVDSENNNLVYLAAGNHGYVCNVSETQNYTAASNSSTYVINKVQTVLNLTIQPSQPEIGQQVNFTCRANHNQSTITFYENNTLLTSGIGNISYNKSYSAYDVYTITCNISESQNYTSGINVTELTIGKKTDTLSLYINGNLNQNLTVNYSTETNVTGVSVSGTESLFRDNVSVNNPEITYLAVGYYEYKLNTTGNEIYKNHSGIIYYLNVTRATPNITLIASPSWNATLWAGSNVTCSVDNAQTNISLHRNSSYINSSLVGSISDIANLSVGNYSYVCNSSQTQNYTAYSVNNTLNITKITDTINLYLNGNEDNLTITYGTQSNATATSASGTESLHRDNASVSNPEIANLSAGYHEYKVNSTGNANYTAAAEVIYYLNVTRATPNITLTADSWSVTLGQQTNVTCSVSNAQTNISLYQNGTYVNSSLGGSMSNVANLTVGTYSYVCNSSQTQNYTAHSVSNGLVIGTLASSLNLTLNGSNSNRTIKEGESVNIKAIILTPSSGQIKIYENGTKIWTQNSPANMIRTYNSLGYYELTASYEGATNYSAINETLYINVTDYTVPVIGLNQPANNSWNKTNSLTFSFTVNDSSLPLNCSLYVNSILNQTNSSTQSNTQTDFAVSGLQEGINQNWTIRCTDSEENSANSTRTFNIDLTNPAANITSGNFETSDSTPTITINLSDALSPTLGYTVYVNGSINKQGSGIPSGVLTNITLNQINSGTNEVIIEAEDSAGNKQNSSMITINLTGTVVYLVSPEAGYISNSNDVNFTFRFSSDFDTMNCSLYSNNVLNQSNETTSEDTNTTFVVENIPDEKDIEWKVECINASETASDTRYLTIDTTPPTWSNNATSIPSGSNYNGSETEFSITFTDNIELDSVLIEHNFTGNWTNTTMTCTGTIQKNCTYSTLLSVGGYSYRFIGNDSAGWTNTTNYLDYNVDKAVSNFVLLLNDMDSDIWVAIGEQVKITVQFISPEEGYGYIYDNGESYSDFSGAKTNIYTAYYSPIDHNISVDFYGTNSYTSAEKSYIVHIYRLSINITTQSNSNFTFGQTFNINATINPVNVIDSNCTANLTLSPDLLTIIGNAARDVGNISSSDPIYLNWTINATDAGTYRRVYNANVSIVCAQQSASDKIENITVEHGWYAVIEPEKEPYYRYENIVAEINFTRDSILFTPENITVELRDVNDGVLKTNKYSEGTVYEISAGIFNSSFTTDDISPQLVHLHVFVYDDEGNRIAHEAYADFTLHPPQPADFWGYGILAEGERELQAGDIIRAYDPDGTLCGSYTVDVEGQYGLLSCEADLSGTGEDEGAVPDDNITFTINGNSATAVGDTIWQMGATKQVNLTGVAALQLVSPANNDYINDNTTFFDWSSEISALINFTLLIDDDNSFATPISNITGISDTNYTLNISQSLAEGIYYWKIQKFENSTFQNETSAWNFTVDITAPNVTSVQAAPDPISWGDSTTISVNVTDNYNVDYVISNVVFPNGYTVNYTMSSIGGTSYEYEIPKGLTTQVGQYNITIFTADKAGNTNNSETTSFTVEVAGATAAVIITEPNSNTAYNTDDAFNVTANITAVSGAVTGCNATISFSDDSFINITSGETLIHAIEDLAENEVNSTTWNISANSIGSSNITVTTNCTSGLSDDDTITNISVSDNLAPGVVYITISPSQPFITSNITINATGDDSSTGNSNILLCQLRIDIEFVVGEWQNLNASDGAYDEPVEEVTKNLGNLSEDTYTAYVRCQDVSGWSSSTTNYKVFNVYASGADVTITSPRDASAVNVNSSFDVIANVTTISGNLTDCNLTISFSNESVINISSEETFVKSIGNLSEGETNTTTWNVSALLEGTSTVNVSSECEVGAGDVDSIDLTVSSCYKEISLVEGWNLISLPCIGENKSVPAVLSSIDGNYTIVEKYDAIDTADHWKKYDVSVPSWVNDLHNMSTEFGYWVYMTSNATLISSGDVGSSYIDLYSGWNLAGYPSSTTKNVSSAMSSIEGFYTIVEKYDATDTSDHWKKYDVNVPSWVNDLENLSTGYGYWAYALDNVTWNVIW